MARLRERQGIRQGWASSGAVRLDEGEDVLLGQLVWVLGLLGVMHTDAIPPLPEEPAVVADAGEEKGGQRAVPTWSRSKSSPPTLAPVTSGMGVLKSVCVCARWGRGGGQVSLIDSN